MKGENMALSDYKKELDKVVLSEDDKKALKLYAVNEDLSVGALVSFVLNEKVAKPIPDKFKFDLKIRNYIDEDCKITDEGKKYLDSEETKNRVLKIIEI